MKKLVILLSVFVFLIVPSFSYAEKTKDHSGTIFSFRDKHDIAVAGDYAQYINSVVWSWSSVTS